MQRVIDKPQAKFWHRIGFFGQNDGKPQKTDNLPKPWVCGDGVLRQPLCVNDALLRRNQKGQLSLLGAIEASKLRVLEHIGTMLVIVVAADRTADIQKPNGVLSELLVFGRYPPVLRHLQ